MKPGLGYRIGIIGGTFNPVHLGHIIIARQFRELAALDKAFFVPANISPFKTDEPASGATSEQRLAMLGIAIRNHPEFEIDTFELDSGGISYSIDTVRHFRLIFPDADLYMLIGDDQAEYFKQWKDWEEILKKVQLCIAGRAVLFDSADKKRLLGNLTIGQKAPMTINNSLIDIASTDIRSKISRGEEVSHLLDKNVYEFIKIQKLYKQ